MSELAFLFDPCFAEHETAPGHPESPERIAAIQNVFEPARELWLRVSPREATLEELALCHGERYVTDVLEAISAGATELAGGDVSVGPDSGRVAMLAVGGVIDTVNAILDDKADTAFCAVRPPGHHARPSAAVGFCLFGNVAIAARHAIRNRGLDRVAIIDWDVHHGNGTQEIFYSDSSVLFCSTHQWPWYPGSGSESEQGEGAGTGLTINAPLPAGSGGKEVIAQFEDRFIPAIDAFEPDLILISAGFDSRLGDPLGQFRLQDSDFAQMTRILREAAGRHCNNKVVSVLEGGYHLEGLASAVKSHIDSLGT